MDKIVYTCGATYLGYEFPTRKWWDFQKKERFAEFILEDIFEEAENSNERFFQEEGISLRVRIEEYRTDGFVLQMDEYRQDEIRRAFLRHILKKRHYEAMFVMDWDGESFAGLLPFFAEDTNYLAVLTEHPKAYEGVMEHIAMEYGLIGMVFSDYREFAWYQRQVCVNRQALVLWGNGAKYRNRNGKTVFYRFQKGDFVVDFSDEQDCRRMFLGKRMEADYVNMPIFLDNMVKNRYNSLVNEGLQQKGQLPDAQQNVYRSEHENKLTEKRKGIRKWKKRKIF